MAGSLNKVLLLGNLGRDPEIRKMQNGKSLASFSVATSERWKDRDGTPQERTEWHRVVIFAEGLVSVVERYLRKGSKVYIEGTLQTRKWTDSSSGQEKYTTEVVLQGFGSKLIMLDSRGGSNGGSGGGGGGGGGGGDGGYSGDSGQYGGSGGSSGSGGGGGGEQARHQGRSTGAGGGGGSGGARAADLDDDIPF